MSILRAALSYLEKGFSVIPLWSPELVKKRPSAKLKENFQKALQNNQESTNPLPEEQILEDFVIKQCKQPKIAWKEYQTRLPTKEEVTQWFSEDPTPNVAIVTGGLSKIVAFDVDSEEGQRYADDEGGFPDTVKVKTGKGVHIYMKHPGFHAANQVDTDIGLDVRGDGGYLVAPPSIHGSGRIYQWDEGFSIDQIDPAQCTPWMIDYLQCEKTKKKTSKSNSKTKESAQLEKNTNGNNDYAEILRNGLVEGERNHKATKLIGHLLKTNMKQSEIWEMLRIWNDKKNKPPMEESELKRTFQSVKKAEEKSKGPKLSIDSALDKTEDIVSEYDENYLRIPFAGDNFSLLEEKTNGGFMGGRFYILGGIPSSGKTVLLNCMADNICLMDQPVIIFSYDDGKKELLYRSFARFSRFSIEDFNKKTVSKDAIRNICKTPDVKKIRGMKYVYQQMLDIADWEDLIEQVKKKHKKPPVIMIDYLRKLRADKTISDERLRVNDIVSKLTDLAKKHNVPVLAISELARDSYRSGQRLSMASFKESGTIEYEASWLGILAVTEERNGEYHIKDDWEKIIEHDGIIDIIVFKAKRGTGETGRIPLKIDKDKMTVSCRTEILPINRKSTVKKSSKFGQKGA